MHYVIEGYTDYRFENLRLVDKFRNAWPGALGRTLAVSPSMYEPPVWDICTDPRPEWWGMILYVDNRSIPVRF